MTYHLMFRICVLLGCSSFTILILGALLSIFEYRVIGMRVMMFGLGLLTSIFVVGLIHLLWIGFRIGITGS